MHIERRKHPRFKVNDGRVWTGRWSSPSVFETSASLVNDLSLGGARVLDIVGSRRRRIPLDPTGSARQFPDSPGQGPGGSMVNQGDYLVRLEFDTSCPEPFVMCFLLEAPASESTFVVCEAVPE